ncbi:SBBP repeat-containing protein [Corallococcus sp. M34]|uniref:SBBP repeat-containing protein n=1 Tax=Citreicoccus inhibens TaxID=2849499 RepID=UPI001C23324A|nr:SBBP repeat-containing protein [Citreicoccus inhibens]MBU8897907.1 SBBP repeat-containing protein [Citreicoccus inhibens]
MMQWKAMQRRMWTGVLALGLLAGCQGENLPDSQAETSGSQSQALTCTNLIPVMTSATTPSGIASASGSFNSTYDAWKAFDGNYSFWLSPQGQTPAWLAYQFTDGARTVRRYAITYSNGDLVTRAPKDWTLEGWTGSAWVVVDTRTNQTGWPSAQAQRREFDVATPGSFVKYRLNVTDDNDPRTGNVVVSIGALELMSCEEPVTVWTRTSGGAHGEPLAYGIAGTPAGRTYLTGFTNVGLEGTPTATGPTDGFIIARDSSGTVLWSRQFGSPTSQVWPYAIATTKTSGQVLAAGAMHGPLDGAPQMGSYESFLTKYSDTGVRQWTRLLGTTSGDTGAYGVAVDGVDNAFLAGSTWGSLDGNTRIGLHDAFVSKYDSAGNRLWTRTVGATDARTEARRASTDSSGNVFISGWTTGALDGNSKTGPSDAFVTKFDTNGVKQWTRQTGTTSGGATAWDTTTDASGNIYLTGSSMGGMDGVPLPVNPDRNVAFVAKYSPAGVKLWVWELKSGSASAATGIFASADGIYVSGGGVADVARPDDTSGGRIHNFVAKLDFNASLKWVVQQPPPTINGAFTDIQPYGLTVDAAGSPYLGGFLYGDFDGNTLKGRPDAFVTKLSPR